MNHSTVRDVLRTLSLTFSTAEQAREAMARLVETQCVDAPVLDDRGRLAGMLSASAFTGGRVSGLVSSRMEDPGVVATTRSGLPAVNRALLDRQAQRALVVDDFGRLVGQVCALDLLRAELGLPPEPADAGPRAHWTPPRPLEGEHVEREGTGPAVLALLDGPNVVWAHTATSLRRELGALAARRLGRTYTVQIRGHHATHLALRLFENVCHGAATAARRPHAR